MSALSPFDYQRLMASGRISPSLLTAYGMQAGLMPEQTQQLTPAVQQPGPLSPGPLQAPEGMQQIPTMQAPSPLSPGELQVPSPPAQAKESSGMSAKEILGLVNSMRSGASSPSSPLLQIEEPTFGTLRHGVGLGSVGRRAMR